MREMPWYTLIIQCYFDAVLALGCTHCIVKQTQFTVEYNTLKNREMHNVEQFKTSQNRWLSRVMRRSKNRTDE